MIITHVGPYSIGQKISEAKGAKEYDEEHYENFSAAGAPRTFQGEQFYEGGYVSFAGVDDWDLTIATINGVIYKFGLVKMAVWKSMTKSDYNAAKAYLLKVLQRPSKGSMLSKQMVWEQPEGSVTLNIRSAMLPEATKKVTAVVVDITSGDVMRELGVI